MEELFQVCTVAEARARLDWHLPAGERPRETVGLTEALGRVLAESITSPLNLPPFDRSTVDGFAVRARDTFGASESLPALLDLTGEVSMGQAAAVRVGPYEAVQIPTGGELPAGADAVVMLEYVYQMGKVLTVSRPAAPGTNVAMVGEDVRVGEELLPAGQRLRPADVGALAGVGIGQVSVFRRPVVAILSTGDELVLPEQAAGPGQIRDINSYSLAAAVTAAGGIPRLVGIVKDELSILQPVLHEALTAADMVLISGGSSVGAKDITPVAINALGSPGVVVHGVSLKPGKPTILAAVGGKPVYGLPGHPVSVLVAFETLVRPVLERLAGLSVRPVWEATVSAVLSKSVRSTAGREEHVRVILREKEGAVWAEPLLGKSGSISTLARADGTVVIPLGINGLSQGETVQVRLL